MPFLVGASMTLSWCFADEATAYTRGVLAALKKTYTVVPSLWPFEVASTLVVAERRKRITQEGIAAFVEMLRTLPIQVERREAVWLCQATIRLAREHRVTAYDAAYLDLAKREELSLATLDHDLQAAGRTLGIAALDL
jgi:predicted nucleic acid-binding protein